MGRGIDFVSILAVGFLAGTPAALAEDRLVLLFCDDVVETGVECSIFAQTLRKETADLGLEVEVGSIEEKLASGIQLPPAIVAETKESDAAAAVWLTRGNEEGVEVLYVHVYTPGSLTTYAKLFTKLDDVGQVDLGDLSFRLHTLLSAGLLPELPEIDVDLPDGDGEAKAVVEPTLAGKKAPVPDREEYEEPREWSLRRSWVRLHEGYALLGYPISEQWYHGVSVRVTVLALPALEVFVDAYFTIPRRISYSGEQDVTLENNQYLVGVGVGYTFTVARVLSMIPLVGFHVGVSDTMVFWGEKDKRRAANTAAWTGIEFRITPIRWVSIVMNAAFENLFNYERYALRTSGGTVEVFGLSQLRMTVFAGACLSF